MSKFRSKAVTIEAVQWWKNGDHPLDHVGEIVKAAWGPDYERLEGELVRFFRHPAFPGASTCEDCSKTYHAHGYLDTAQGGHKVCPGDWIIPESHSAGKFYPCKPDVFESRYEAVT
jgi:hypothetical protein